MAEHEIQIGGAVWVEPCVSCGIDRWATAMTTGTPCSRCEPLTESDRLLACPAPSDRGDER